MIPGSSSAHFFGAAGSGGGYEIERSLRFNSADSAYLSRTPASAGNRKTWTWAGWVKLSKNTGLVTLFDAFPTASTASNIIFDSEKLRYADYNGGYTATVTSSAVFRDFSAWYHIVCAYDSPQATASNRVKLYVNGSQVTQLSASSYPTQNYDSFINTTSGHGIGGRTGGTYLIDGYLADIHFIDGQALDPTSFGKFDANGVWQPKAYTGTYGTNGFWLKFLTGSGIDSSGNNNFWTAFNFGSSGAGNDSLVDTPTSYGEDTGAGGEVRGNYCTLNPLIKGAATTLSNGNLDADYSAWNSSFGSMLIPTSGKWFFEVIPASTASLIGIAKATENLLSAAATYYSNPVTSYSYYATGDKALGPGNTQTTYGASFTSSDTVGVAFDADAGTIVFYKNGVSQGTAFTGITGQYVPAIASITTGSSVNFGQRPFAYTAPSGFKALCTQNLPAPTITKPSTVMDVALWTGNGSARSITGLGFNPDLVWIKGRSGATDHALYDSVRGAEKRLESNTTDAEVTSDGGVTAFNSDGFSLGTLAQVNTNTATYAGWTWDAGSSTVTNTAGTISSQVRANASAGFSIVTYSGVDSPSTNTVGHGLGVAPTLWIIKNRTNASPQGWVVNFTFLDGSVDYMFLNLTNAKADQGSPWSTLPTSTVFTLGANDGNTCDAGSDYVAYCFAPVAGYSAFGSYTGNGSADGPFVYTGFRPRWMMIKCSSISATNWIVQDSARDTSNIIKNALFPNTSGAEDTVADFTDFTSNGFKLRFGGVNAYNANNATYIYAAFAEHPFALARAR